MVKEILTDDGQLEEVEMDEVKSSNKELGLPDIDGEKGREDSEEDGEGGTKKAKDPKASKSKASAKAEGKAKKEAEHEDDEDYEDDDEDEDEDDDEMESKKSKKESKKSKKEGMPPWLDKNKKDDDEDDDEDKEEAKSKKEEKEIEVDVSEDVSALIDGEELSDEFKTKAATIFEAAVKSKIRSEVERISQDYHDTKEQEIDTFKEELTEKVDTYLNYVVEEWTKENELAIERGLKGEIAEDFISGLKQLFEDHYIDVPDEKYDVLEAQSEKISELEEKLNEAIQKSVNLTGSNEKLVREQVISEVSEDLADTEIEKFKSLTQDVDFGSEESFREKLDTLKESYFPKIQPSSTSEETFGDEDGSTAKDVDTTDAMRTYMSAISRNQKASA